MPNQLFEFKSYPIVFIGSGISKRYLKNYPTWEDLLNEYWQKINPEIDFYNYLLTIKEKFRASIGDDSDLDHKIYTEAATKIENDFNKLFTGNAIKLEGLDAKRVFSENISPFKYSICQRFSSPTLKDDVDLDELNSFKALLKKQK